MKKKKGGKLKWVIIIIIIIAVLGAVFGGDESEDSVHSESEEKTEKEITYKKVSAADLSKILDKNAAKAAKDYKGKYLEVTGELGTIDSEMSYICITSGDFDWTIIQCYIQNEKQENKILDLEQGDKITVKGKCTDVGEVLGYSIKIDSIE